MPGRRRRQEQALLARTIVETFEDAIEELLPIEPVSQARIDMLRLLRGYTDEPHGALGYVYRELGRIYIEIANLSTAEYGTLSEPELGRLRLLWEERSRLEQMRDMLERILVVVEPIIRRFRDGDVPSDDDFSEALQAVALAIGWKGAVPEPVVTNFANKIAPVLEA